jgi:hypothetical protein
MEGLGVVDGVEHELPDNVELLPLLLVVIGCAAVEKFVSQSQVRLLNGTSWNRVDYDVIF